MLFGAMTIHPNADFTSLPLSPLLPPVQFGLVPAHRTVSACGAKRSDRKDQRIQSLKIP